jgi:hypothetical protein
MAPAIRAVVLLVVATTAGCGSDSSEPASKSPTHQSSGTAAAPAQKITGRWERVQTCQALLVALKEAHLAALAPGMLAEDWFSNASPSQVARKPDPCSGTRPRRHSHFFTADGKFGSVDDNNQQVDDGTYRIIDRDTLRIGRSRFDYRIEGGKTLILRPVITAAAREKARAQPGKFSEAGWQAAVTYMGLPWKRVSCDGWC